jgi:O-antigen/teichoic acid export membrane protein
VKYGQAKVWLLLISKFLAGQGIVQALNLITGLILLRVLTIEEYALYTLANVMLVLASIGSNLGLTSALVTLGSQVKDNRTKLGSLVATIQEYRRQLFYIVNAIIIVLTPFLTHGRGWSWGKITLCVLFIALSNWVQISLSLRTGVFDIHHDANSQCLVGLSSAILRLILVTSLCIFFPSALLILIVNFVALALSDLIAMRRCQLYFDWGVSSDPLQGEAVKKFIYPLAPGVIYYAIAGQITVILLGLFGSTSSVAQVSALANYGRIISMLGLLNIFFVQPYFARITYRDIFVKKALFMLGGLSVVGFLLIISSFVVPTWWLLLLGHNYSNLLNEMPIAVAIPLVVLLTDMLYALLLSKEWTRGQNWAIGVSLTIQVVFIALLGIHTVQHALWLALLLSLGNLAVQATILIKHLISAEPYLLSSLTVPALGQPS